MEMERQCEGTVDTIHASFHVPEAPQLAPSHSHDGSNTPTEASANADKMIGIDTPLPMLEFTTGAEPLSTQSLVLPRDEVFNMVLQMHSDNPQDDKVAFQCATDVLERLQQMFRDQTSLMECSRTTATELETETAFLLIDQLAAMTKRIGAHITETSEKSQKVVAYHALFDFYFQVRRILYRKGKSASDHVDYLGIMSESVLAHFELIESRLSSKAEKSSLSLLTTKSRVAKKVSKEVIQKYADNLPDSEKTAFKAASDILEHLRSIYDSKVYFPSFVTHRVERILQGLEIFMNLLEIHNSEPGRLLVGGVHCIFTLCLEYMESFERFTFMMESIGRNLSYLSQHPFQDSEEPQKVLVEAYCDLLDFCVKSRYIFSNWNEKSPYSKGFRLFLKLKWEPFEDEFKSLEIRFLNNIIEFLRSLDYQAREDHIRRFEKESKAATHRLKTESSQREIMRWLSPDDYENTHNSHFNKRFEYTGQWLLDEPDFIEWRDKVQSSLLWCHGAPGSGKTVLASLVIDHLSARYELSTAMNAGVMFIYCPDDFLHPTEECIMVAISQLCRKMKPLLSLQKLYEKHNNANSKPLYHELRSTFQAIIAQFDRLYFVIDALDECVQQDKQDVCRFLCEILDLPQPTHIKLLVISRLDSGIEQISVQKSCRTIKIQATVVDKDIAKYIKTRMDQLLQDDHPAVRNQSSKNKILRELTTNAGGMFLWVKSLLDAISGQPFFLSSAEALHSTTQTLQGVPEEVKKTYKRILNVINQKPVEQRELAKRVLMCTAYSRRPISINHLDHLAHIVLAETHPESLKSLKSSRDIIDACANLITIDSGTQDVRFVHPSAQKFLTSPPSKGEASDIRHELVQGVMAHRKIAKRFISLLSNLYSRSLGDSENVEKCFPPLGVLLSEWPHHVLAANLKDLPSNDELVILTSSFLNKCPPVLTPYTVKSRQNTEVYFMFTPKTLAKVFHLTYTNQPTKPLEKKELMNVHGINQDFIVIRDDHFAMHYTVSVLKSTAVADRLFTWSYPINHRSQDTKLDIIKSWEVDCESDSPGPIPDECQLPPLYSLDSNEMAGFLLNSGASVDPQHLNGEVIDPLIFFVEKDNVDVTQLLLGKLVGQDGRERCEVALQYALKHSKVGVLPLLWNQGADIDTVVGGSGTILQAVALLGNIDVMKHLLAEGINVNAEGGKYGSALQAAAASGNVEAVALLLESKANINAQGGEYGNALQIAVASGNVELVELLLKEKASISAQGVYPNALHTAAYCGEVKIMQLLLNVGADVDSLDGAYGNVLQAVISSTAVTVKAIQLLLDHGADVNAQGGAYGNALQAAVTYGNVDVVQLLLDYGADVNAEGGVFGNALQAAVVHNKVQAVDLLLDSGADINAKGGIFGTALQAASYACHLSIIKKLLDMNADVNAQGGKYGTALQAIFAPAEACMNDLQSSKTPENIFRSFGLLLDHGADITTYTADSKYGSAVAAAQELWKNDGISFSQFVKYVQVLESRGAEGAEETSQEIKRTYPEPKRLVRIRELLRTGL